MKKIRAIVKRPDEKYGHMTNVSNTLENFQRTVGGYIEVVNITDKVVCVCNEEGKNLGLPKNFRIPGDVIVGDVILCGVDGDEFCDIPIEFATWKTILDKLEDRSWI